MTTLSYSPENQRALEELDAQRKLQDLVVSGTRVGLWDWTPGTDEFEFNPQIAELLGYEAEELEPSLHTWELLLHPEDLEMWGAERCHHARGDRHVFEAVYRLRHRGGDWVHVLSRSSGLERDSEGRPMRVTGTCMDITRLRQAELEARRAAAAKSLFLARMSHEIRTPLNGILGVMEMLDETEDTQERGRLMKIMRQSGDLILETLNDVLDLAKIEAGAMLIEERVFSPREEVERIVEIFAEVGSGSNITVSLDTTDRAPAWVLGDGHKLRQIVCNLVSNAVKFTDEGSVTVKLDAHGSTETSVELLVEVADTGCGIADADAVWESYQQADATVSRTHGGTGLGLAICRELTALLGGTIGLTSVPGSGSTFTLSLPVQPAGRPHHRKRVSQGSEAQEARQQLRVLVAEDNPVNRLVIQATLERLGVAPTIVEDGAQAVEECRRTDFDLVLLDIQMPVMDGIEAAAEISKLGPEGGRPMLVAISADTSETNYSRCLAVGLERFISKPFQTDTLKELLDGIVARRIGRAA